MTVLNTVDLDQVKLKLYEKLKPSGWGDKLKTFIMSDDFDNILKYLLKDAKAGNRFTPQLKQVFRAFEECPYNDLKVIMVGQDPYPYINVADGIAFSCSNLGRIEASLKFMYKELEDTVYKDGFTWDPDLKRWSNQGILMFNSSLTTTINKVGQHYKVWQPFNAFLFDMITCNNPGLVYVFMGKKAEEWAEMIPDNNYKIMVSHPASAAHSQLEKWDSKDMFNRISQTVKKQFNYDIVW